MENKLKQETIGNLRNRIVCDYKNIRYGGEGNGLHFKRLAKNGIFLYHF